MKAVSNVRPFTMERISASGDAQTHSHKISRPALNLLGLLLQYLAARLLKKFMLNSAEYEILNAHKYKNIKKFRYFQA